MRIETRELGRLTSGTRRELVLCRFGRSGTGPKVYLQAGLHADEMPGVLVLQHLIPLIEAQEAAGQLAGEVLVVPMANPIGLANWSFQRPQGRQEADSLHNFNRGFPELATLVAEQVAPLLSQDEAANRDVIRAAFRQALSELSPRTEMEEMQAALLAWSCDADHVLDLHCDHFAILHLYASPARPEVTRALCRATGARLALIQDISGGNAFDEAHTVPWLRLQDRFGAQFPIPNPCFSTTLEYRGQFDVGDDLAAKDAEGLMDFLAALGVAPGWAGRPRHGDGLHLPLGGAVEIFAPQGGVVTWDLAVGADVRRGDVLGHVTEPMGRTRLPLISPADGILFRQELWRSCLRGQSLAHVAGAEVMRDGYLLSD